MIEHPGYCYPDVFDSIKFKIKNTKFIADAKIWGQPPDDGTGDSSDSSDSLSASSNEDEVEEVESNENSDLYGEESNGEEEVRIVTPPPTQATRPKQGEKRPPSTQNGIEAPPTKCRTGTYTFITSHN